MIVAPIRHLILTAALCVALGPGANAASISLIYTGDRPISDGFIDAPPGTILTFEVLMDFTDLPTFGGGFDVIFDSDRAQFDSLVNFDIGNPEFSRDPDIMDGLLESWGFASFSTIAGPAIVGTLTFTVLPDVLTGPGFIALGPTSGPGGPFICNLGDCISYIDVEYNSIEFGVVPLPASAWLLASGLLAFFRLARSGRSD